MIYLATALALEGNIICSIDGVNATMNTFPQWDKWSHSYPKDRAPDVVHLQGQDRALRIDAIYKYKDESSLDPDRVLAVDFWVGNADGTDMTKWNYYRFDVELITPAESSRFYKYFAIKADQSGVSDPQIDPKYPGDYRCVNVETEDPIPEQYWEDGQ